MQHARQKNGGALFVRTALALTVTFLYGSLAKAQTLEEMVVSASRVEQRSFDAPATIQSVDRATIENAGPQVNLSESLNRVPGLTILHRQNYAQDLQVSIRGFGARSAFGIRGIRLLVDGIPATTPDGQGQGSSISLTSTDRIEVLRGPLAQLYGNSAGGVIQAFTRRRPNSPNSGRSITLVPTACTARTGNTLAALATMAWWSTTARLTPMATATTARPSASSSMAN